MRVIGALLSIAGIGMLLLVACAKPTRHQEPPFYVTTPMPDEAAELVALYLSGKMVAPAQLYERVHRELEQLRTEYPPEQARIQIAQFDLAVMASAIACQVDSPTFAAVTEGAYTAWDSLNAVHHLESISPSHYPGHQYFLQLRFDGRRNPKCLAKAYATLPGFLQVWNEGGVPGFGCIPSFFPRMSGNTIAYLATNYPAGGDCGYGTFWYYASSGGGVGCFGFWERLDHDTLPRWWPEAQKNMDEMFAWLEE